MNAEVFAEWMRAQGSRVLRTPSSFWHESGTRVYQAFPYHWVIQPSEDELVQLLRKSKSLALRYSTSFEAPLGCASYHVIYEKASYGFQDLGTWARKNVRRGLRHCSVEPISFDRLGREGWALQHDTLDRQARHLRVSREDWARRCQAAARLPGFEAWGVLVGSRLAASVMTFSMQDCCYMLYQQCHRDFLKEHVNNALSFTVTQAMIGRPNILSIFYALHSLDAPASMDEFKFRMGYSAKPVKQRVVFHPGVAPMFNSVSHALIKSIKAFCPANTVVSKAEGMVRFYIQGNRPVGEQEMPEPLRAFPAYLTDGQSN
jgi:hypothetical protein